VVALPLKAIAVVFCPLHRVWFVGVETVGGGETVIVKFTGVPVQVPKEGVTEMVLTLLVVPVFTPLNDGMVFEPLAFVKPLFVLSFIQLKVAPEVPEKLTAVDACPGQIV
jgi:hypothetical protein